MLIKLIMEKLRGLKKRFENKLGKEGEESTFLDFPLDFTAEIQSHPISSSKQTWTSQRPCHHEVWGKSLITIRPRSEVGNLLLLSGSKSTLLFLQAWISREHSIIFFFFKRRVPSEWSRLHIVTWRCIRRTIQRIEIKRLPDMNIYRVVWELSWDWDLRCTTSSRYYIYPIY